MIKKIFMAVFLFGILVLSGCAHVQKPITLDSNYLTPGKKIGVLVVDSPEGSFVPFGQIGLLDLAIIFGANGDLGDHLKQFKADDFVQTKSQFLTLLKKRGINPVEIRQRVDLEELPGNGELDGFAVKDFSQIRDKYNINDLLVLRLVNFGVKRNYYGFVPTSGLNGFAAIEGQLIDLKTHKLKWYYSESLENSVTEPWDEPDLKFPNVSESVYKAIEQAGFALKQNFSAAGG